MKKRIITLVAGILSLAMVGAVLLLPLTAETSAPSASDNYAGTLQYLPSADGSTVTISYEVNGEAVSYTVPNQDNYLFGGYAGTDDLGRSLFDSAEVGSYGSTGEHYVGLFYFLWHGEHGDPGIYDLQKILDQAGPEAAKNESCGLYGPQGSLHWFAEPLYGYYYARDGWVMRKHAELLTLANIDFLYFDVTNAVTYTDNAIQLMSILHELNEQGFDAPQVVFYTNSSGAAIVQKLYDTVYSRNLYPDTWFRVGGKPVIIGPEDANINDFFTMKRNVWPQDYSENGWPWMSFEWPQHIYESAYDFDGSAISVSIAQHSGTVRFSDSAMYGDHTNRGRSFYNPENYSSNRASKFQKVLKDSLTAWQADPSLTLQGLNFQKQFDNAVESDAMYVLVTGWNEWVASRGNTEDGSIVFVDTASMEFSRDAEMMRGGYFDNYYMQLTYNVQRIKGTAPVVVQDMRKPIDVSGDFDQWNDVTVTYTDAKGDTADRNSLGFGQTHYTNTSGRNDIVSAKMTADTQNLYFYVQTAEPITAADTASSWMQIYLNADRETTGWYGYDFIINHKAKDADTTTVAKYNGNEFETLGEVSYRVEGNQMMIAVPLEMLGIEGYKEINVEFKIADSDTVYDEMEDFYCDGDAAPLGRLNYIFQNYIPGVSQITYPEDETTAETEATATTTEATQAATSEATNTTADTSKGCASSLSTALLLTVLPLACAALIRRKED
ncbi:MAG: hypothetical protein E7610_04680 [Ruminococcaceae bacterium]|nr:hypothetical protein [Oscillospiraceae bacterium]